MLAGAKKIGWIMVTTEHRGEIPINSHRSEVWIRCASAVLLGVLLLIRLIVTSVVLVVGTRPGIPGLERVCGCPRNPAGGARNAKHEFAALRSDKGWLLRQRTHKGREMQSKTVSPYVDFLRAASLLVAVFSSSAMAGNCSGNPGPDRLCAAPVIFYTAWGNVTNGPYRYSSATQEFLELGVGVYPSPDSDQIDIGPSVPLTDNGLETVVTATHPTIFGGNPTNVKFSGIVSGGGYSWGTYALRVPLVDYDPSSDPAVAEPWNIVVENPDSDGSPTITSGQTYPLDPNARPGLVTDVTITGGGLTPTIAWTPSNTRPNQVTDVTLFKVLTHDQGVRAEHSERLANDATSFQIPSEFSGAYGDDTSLILGQTYMLLIQVSEFTADQLGDGRQLALLGRLHRH